MCLLCDSRKQASRLRGEPVPTIDLSFSVFLEEFTDSFPVFVFALAEIAGTIFCVYQIIDIIYL